MQDTFIDAYTNLSKFENRSSMERWQVIGRVSLKILCKSNNDNK